MGLDEVIPSPVEAEMAPVLLPPLGEGKGLPHKPRYALPHG